jgi:hypothetical protein
VLLALKRFVDLVERGDHTAPASEQVFYPVLVEPFQQLGARLALGDFQQLGLVDSSMIIIDCCRSGLRFRRASGTWFFWS